MAFYEEQNRFQNEPSRETVYHTGHGFYNPYVEPLWKKERRKIRFSGNGIGLASVGYVALSLLLGAIYTLVITFIFPASEIHGDQKDARKANYRGNDVITIGTLFGNEPKKKRGDDTVRCGQKRIFSGRRTDQTIGLHKIRRKQHRTDQNTGENIAFIEFFESFYRDKREERASDRKTNRKQKARRQTV